MAWAIDSLLVFELHPTGPESVQVVGASFFPADRTECADFDALSARYSHRMDSILPEDNVAVAGQQKGLRVPVNAASKFTHMETLCHAFDNWVLDRVLG